MLTFKKQDKSPRIRVCVDDQSWITSWASCSFSHFTGKWRTGDSRYLNYYTSHKEGWSIRNWVTHAHGLPISMARHVARTYSALGINLLYTIFITNSTVNGYSIHSMVRQPYEGRTCQPILHLISMCQNISYELFDSLEFWLNVKESFPDKYNNNNNNNKNNNNE